MLDAGQKLFPGCDGLIAVAAPCDYRPVEVALYKMKRTGRPILLELVETPDVVAALGAMKTSQWLVAFALETHDKHMRALQKLERKKCDLVVLNSPTSIHGPDTQAEVIDPSGAVLASLSGSKEQVGVEIFRIIQERLIRR
jgi:phosphopantothenoylcysteine decarboxylase/phosphopantothenate--cysteine ligase